MFCANMKQLSLKTSATDHDFFFSIKIIVFLKIKLKKEEQFHKLFWAQMGGREAWDRNLNNYILGYFGY